MTVQAIPLLLLHVRSRRHWHKVLQAERPLCVNFLLTRTAGEDRFLAAAASALAFSYFSILGVTED
jgi:hypothetical protein